MHNFLPIRFLTGILAAGFLWGVQELPLAAQPAEKTPKLPTIELPEVDVPGPDASPAGPDAPDMPTPSDSVPPTPTPGGAKLPWETEPAPTAPPVLRPFTSPREVFERYGVQGSLLENFFNGQPLGPSEQDVLSKILYRVPQLGLESLQSWRKTNVSWDQLAASPTDFRLENFLVEGRVTRVQKIPMDPEFVTRYEFEHYYQVSMKLSGAPFLALICARVVPEAWLLDTEIDEPARLDGMFLKIGDPTLTDPQLIFVSPRVAWLPDRPAPQHHVGSAQIQLAKLGVDWGAFDAVLQSNRQAIGPGDRESFYEVLHAVSLPAAHDWFKSQHNEVDLGALLNEPASHQGEVFTLSGAARRILRIEVSDTDMQQRYGIDHYFTVDMRIPVGKRSIVMGKDPTGKNNPVYNNTFPVTVCLRRLPPGFAPAESLDKDVQLKGVFFKVWSYKAGLTDKFQQLQPAPLFVGDSLAEVVTSTAGKRWADIVVGGVMIGGMLLVAGVFWWFRRTDAAAHREAAATLSQPPDFSKISP